MASVIGIRTVLRIDEADDAGHCDRRANDNRRGSRYRSADLDTMIEREVIPRLLVVSSGAQTVRTPVCNDPVTPAEAAMFAPLPLEMESHELLAVVERFLDRGVPTEEIFVELLAPSARRLGQMWEDDSCDFIDVTMGLWRLQEVMRELAIRGLAQKEMRPRPRSALFSPMPGDQHSFGTLMVEETFALAGWQSEVLIDPRRRDLLQAVAEQAFDIVGLTLSCDCPSGTASDFVNSIRSVSKNPDVKIIIGGRLPQSDPGFVHATGADGTAPDCRSALAFADQLVPVSRAVVP
ncbi:cobalamin B12-binding domain-containing protein [Aurantiacibacter poecillastricola]|uniref:cobalamin B12-binding domain-containing protein n=1 Tax=Aurantiacibacter poecillastricola TaxID=3064385 RepID=UPI00273FBD37|nr:cobalamin B12-binding domain-containing protein [Aurantiacibacter sp. 219JJ12-13]MDP5260391.1 cobalamin B12-binding domain-containing protein [Aurantiacibacter sp. 219JJ12-13]